MRRDHLKKKIFSLFVSINMGRDFDNGFLLWFVVMVCCYGLLRFARA
jgi:hypothetical protein